MIIERIGTAAMLEQTAEEAAELTQACLKAARCKRGENPVYKTRAQIQSDLAEEIADVIISIRELLSQDTDFWQKSGRRCCCGNHQKKSRNQFWEWGF